MITNGRHIVKVFAYYEDSLLTDLMFMDLQKFMRSRTKGGARVQPFSLLAAINLMLQIADAVSYLHSWKMADCDLKSMSILVNLLPMDFVFAKLADFADFGLVPGLVKTKREITRYSHLMHNVDVCRVLRYLKGLQLLSEVYESKVFGDRSGLAFWEIDRRCRSRALECSYRTCLAQQWSSW